MGNLIKILNFGNKCGVRNSFEGLYDLRFSHEVLSHFESETYFFYLAPEMGFLLFMVSVYPAAHNGFVKVQHDLLQDLSA